jgi:agmatinase
MNWSTDRLTALRQKYDSGHVGEIFDPRFKAVAQRIFSGNGSRLAPYAGVSTLLSAPYLQRGLDDPGFSALQVALIGVPMDLGVTNRPGARFGPRALRTIERIGPYNHVLGCAPVFDLRVADVGDVPMASRYRLEQCQDDIAACFGRVVDAGVVPLAVGGDHSVTYPILKAVARDGPVGLIHIDAHCDTCGAFDGTKFHHAGPFRNAVLDGLIDPTRTIQIGIRGAAEYLWEFSYDSGMTVIHAEDIARLGMDNIIAQARQLVGAGPVYVSFDVDALDPVYAPGTGTPEIGGMTTREALALLHGLKGLNICGGDVVEVAPQYDSTTNTAQAGAQLLFEILSLMVYSPFVALHR